MYVRVVTGKAGPEGIDKLIAAYEQQVVPGAGNQPGYLGAAFVVDRETGEAMGITRWESLDALNASEQAFMEARRQLGAAQIVEVLDVDRYEMAIEERTGEARSPAFMRINEIYLRPDRIDCLVALMRERAMSVTSQPGCRALLMWVNRATGRCTSA